MISCKYVDNSESLSLLEISYLLCFILPFLFLVFAMPYYEDVDAYGEELRAESPKFRNELPKPCDERAWSVEE